MAVTAAATPIRIVCASTLGAALRQAEHGADARRTSRFRHNGNLQTKFARGASVAGDDDRPPEAVEGDRRSAGPRADSETALEHRVLRHLWMIDDESVRYTHARPNRERAIKRVLAIFGGCAAAGDTTGNSPGTKWTAFNAIAEHLDYGRRYTTRTNQVQRSFEDTSRKQRALDLVAAA
jgi:hypothetical protein